LDQADCLAELMVAGPHGPAADWGAPIPDGCSEWTGLPRADSAVRMADDHCALVVHPVPDERSRADSALDDSAARMADDRYAPAVHLVPDERSADSALDDSVVPMMDDHCVPAAHPVRAERSADSAAPMTDDHCAPADHPVLGERSVRAGSVAAGYSENCFRADCWRRVDLPVADSRQDGR
jgi:hypothetical protein